MARVIAGPPCLRPTEQRLDLRNGEAACLRECSGLSFGPSLRVKLPSRAWRTAQSRSPPFALDGGGRERLVHIGGNQTARRTIILWRFASMSRTRGGSVAVCGPG